jgi:amino acid adenylation domain-containing protein
VSADQLLSELRALDIHLVVEGDRLRCSAPRGRITEELAKRIAARKPELLLALAGSRAQDFAIPRRPPDAEFPLSFAQERFWFLQSLDPDSTAYNITAFQRLSPAVSVPALQAALGALARRHEILRTTFPERGGSPIQSVREDLAPELSLIDLPGPEAIEPAIAVHAARRFNMMREPLFHVALFRFASSDPHLVHTMHHMICDAWSIDIFFSELQSLCQSCARDLAFQPPPLPVQYGEYALWERARQSTDAIAPQLEYWKNKLQGAPPFLDLPLDYPRPATIDFRPGFQLFELDASASDALKSLARNERATPFMTLLTVFQTLLFRYTQQRDIVVGTPVSTRVQSQLEKLIGCFINTQVLRTEIAPGATTRAILSQVRTTVLESLSNADVPFGTLVGELVTERDLSRFPLFQVAFILQNTPTSSGYSVVSGGTTFDITVYIWESAGRFAGSVQYNANLFRPETMAAFAGCFQTLAAGMAAHPDTPAEQLPMLSAEQQAAWIEPHHGPAAPFPSGCTHEWIERQAALFPDAVAVVFGHEKLTYREISERSSRLANRLRTLGVGPESTVALCLDRSPDLVVAPLAIWKAGGAYLPLDPDFPSHRLAFMLEDSGVSIIISESCLLDKLPAANLPTLVCLDRDQSSIQKESSQAPPSSTLAENLAYMLYTSGSTGRPKGVQVTHHSLVNFLASMQREPGLAASDRLLAVTTFSFDIAGLELWLPLVTGAQVVIAPRIAVVDGAALAGLVRDFAITVMQATPVTWRLLLESGWQGTPGLKILCGGEALTRDLANQLLATGAEMWNLYGPTETTIWSTLRRLSSQERVSIGRPIANTQVYILDEHRNLLPPGVPGELSIGGDGVARGYLHRDELTAERFIKSPVHPNRRLYRTGDIVRQSFTGDLDYMGRVDHQVKLRGFRIELGEIETILEQQPGVLQAVVVVREDEPGDHRLTAYLTTEDSAAPHAATLRKALHAVLPAHMIPGAFLPVRHFPLTPNRKIDRNALRGPEYRPGHADNSAEEPAATYQDGAGQDSSLNHGHLPPRSHVEMAMVEIWREVLGLDKISVLDNFFELGGHSLAATRLISRLRSALDMDLPLRCIFMDPTIASLASHITWIPSIHGYRYISEIPKWNCLISAQPNGSRIPFFFVAGYQKPEDTLLVLSQLLPNLGTDQPVFGFRPRWIDGNAEYASVDEMAHEFLTELRAVQPKGPYLLGGHCVGGIAAMEVAQLLLKEGEEVRLLLFLDTDRPSPARACFTDLHFFWQRVEHIFDVLSDIVLARSTPRREFVRNLMRRKFGVQLSRQESDADRFYQAKVRYRRLLYKHTPSRYPGRISLLVNEQQARYDRDLGWTGVPQQGIDIHVLPGDHTTVLSEHAKEIAQSILRCIDQATADLPARPESNKARID